MATATLDCRLLPDQDPAAFTQELRDIIGDEKVRVETVFASSTPTSPMDTELFGIITPLVHDVHLIEYLLRLLQADAMFSFDIPALLPIKVEAHLGDITVIPSSSRP